METRPPNDDDGSAPPRPIAVNSTRLTAQSERERRPARIVTEQKAVAAAASGANPVFVMLRSLPRQERFFPAARNNEDRHFAIG